MIVVTVSEAKRDLDALIAKVVSNAEPTIITTETGQQIVLLSLVLLCQIDQARVS